MKPGSAVSIEVAQSEDGGAWDAAIGGFGRITAAHRFAWRDVLQKAFSLRAHYLWARDREGTVLGVLPLVRVKSPLFGDYLVSVPHVNYGGAIGRTMPVEQSLIEHAVKLADELGVSHVEFRDSSPRDGWPARTDKVVMELALPTDVDVLHKAVGAKLRAQIKRPVREGATVVQGGAELLDDFYRVFSRNMRDLGTPVYAKRFFRLVLDAFAKDARIFVVHVGGQPTAAGLVVGHLQRLEIPWASSLREFNRIGVNMLLYAEVLRYAIESGYKVFDFGRSSKDGGTYRFKAQWGAKPRQLYWHYWLAPGHQMPALTPSNPKFDIAIRLWRKLPVSVANLVGPHIVRGLP